MASAAVAVPPLARSAAASHSCNEIFSSAKALMASPRSLGDSRAFPIVTLRSSELVGRSGQRRPKSNQRLAWSRSRALAQLSEKEHYESLGEAAT